MPSKTQRQHNLMEGVAHDPAFAKRVGISQKVGRDFVAADMAAGKFKGKEPTMSNAAGMKPRKQMAGAASGGNFGAEPFHAVNGGSDMHPDYTKGTGEQMAGMGDHERATPPAIHHTKGHHPAQAAPNHGPTHPHGHGSHHTYDHGKV